MAAARLAAIRASGLLPDADRNCHLERLFALVAAIVPATLSLAIGRVVRGEDCPGGVVICLTKEGWVSVGIIGGFLIVHLW